MPDSKKRSTWVAVMVAMVAAVAVALAGHGIQMLLFDEVNVAVNGGLAGAAGALAGMLYKRSSGPERAQ